MDNNGKKKLVSIKIEVFLPAGACGCSFANWIDNVWSILINHKEKIEIISLTSDSPRAKELGVGDLTVVVNGEVTPVFLLEQKLHKLLN